jgi:arginyl-tRNA synthetase
MLSLQGNTAPYLMYVHARCRSILRRGGVEGFEPTTIRPVEPIERELAVHLLRLPEVLLSVAQTSRPNLLADHLFGLAQVYGRFYLECPVLQAEDAAVRESRLGLVVATARAMALGLELLGLQALHRM